MAGLPCLRYRRSSSLSTSFVDLAGPRSSSSWAAIVLFAWVAIFDGPSSFSKCGPRRGKKSSRR